MQRLIEIILGLEKGFLSKEGELSLSFNPSWPWQQYVGAGFWNFLLIAGALALIFYVYSREGRSRQTKVVLGVIRGLLIGLVIALLNRPVLTLGQSRREPSILPVLVDDSISMRVRDTAITEGGTQRGRLEAAVELLTQDDREIIRHLSRVHTLKFYRFDSTAIPLIPNPTTQPTNTRDPEQMIGTAEAIALAALQPTGQNTQVGKSIRAVLDELQGQRIAGVVVLTDGRDTPAQPMAQVLTSLAESGVKVYPILVGSDKMPTNVSIQSVSAEESAFKGDIVNVRVNIRGSGFPNGQNVAVQLKDKHTGLQMRDPNGRPIEQTVHLDNDTAAEAELIFKPTQVGPLDLVVEAVKQPGEIDDEDNTRDLQINVLDAHINVLYVDGYPRWEYRYIKNEMIRDQSVEIACLLTSADPSFNQEGDRHIVAFPESIEELMDYDVLLFGDVDPRQFSELQLQMVADFVGKRAGGFGMVSGPRFSPLAYRGTPIEAVLPVNIAKVQPDEGVPITQSFRPVLTKDGEASSVFRFFLDRAANEKYFRDDIQALFWYCKGVAAKPGVGEVYAEHPTDVGPDGRRAPLLVLGRFGAGRTLFSAIDDSWRWRYYTGESVFDTYWVQQLRYLARSKKLGQRRVTLAVGRPVYELGEQVRVTMRVLDPLLLQQLPEQIRVDILDATGRVIKQESLVRQENQPDLYMLSYSADQIGKFVVRLPALAAGAEAMQVPLEISVPRLELAQPQVDRVSINRIASETHGQVIEIAKARQLLPTLIPSAAKVIPVESNQPLWDAPLAMVLFVFLITAEWLLRKLYGML
ncbi:MAG TPA: hypothetical protein VHD56_09820 [Tepidisphaeraceae bacterium]|nr:hypothetical protein [Tepidisphaeraceae bacterium]